jgi:hypothetical protein
VRGQLAKFTAGFGQANFHDSTVSFPRRMQVVREA